MALSKLSGDLQRDIFSQLCNVLDAGIAVAFGSTNSELRALTEAERQQLKAGHEAAAALGRKLGMQSCKELREAKEVVSRNSLTEADLSLLGTLGSSLPVLEKLFLLGESGPDGVQRLAEKLGAGALPSLTYLAVGMHVGDAGASALAAALDQGAMPRLKSLILAKAAIGDAGLVALAPALRRLPALEELYFRGCSFGDEGLAALVAPPPQPAGALPPPTGGLAKLEVLDLEGFQITDAGCATLADAITNGALPALRALYLRDFRLASGAAIKAVHTAYMAQKAHKALELERDERARCSCVIS